MENTDLISKIILVVDDEESIREILKYNLEREDFQVVLAEDGEEAIEKCKDVLNKPDLVLLDVMLPKKDGVNVCKEIRYNLNMRDVPILMISAKGEETDKIIGLEIGADDYITKPFAVREVIARVKANLRKTINTRIALSEEDCQIIQIGDLVIDSKRREVTIRGKKIELTKKEFDVLRFLAVQPGTVVSREDLLKKVWGYGEYVGEIRTIDVTMARLRDKIESKKGTPEFLITKRGVGYYLRETSKKEQ
ncbi:MAG: response regulator [Clostridium sp.]